MKRLPLFIFIFFLSFVHTGFAHTGLESALPNNGDIITEDLKQITLTFESKIEEGSTFELKNSTGETIPVSISLSENVMTGNPTSPLQNGDYQVNWNIIGVDGHPIDGNYTFSVNLPAAEAPAEEPAETPDQSQIEQEAEKGEIQVADEEKAEEVQQNKMPSYVIQTIIGILIVIAIGSIIFITKRKK